MIVLIALVMVVSKPDSIIALVASGQQKRVVSTMRVVSTRRTVNVPRREIFNSDKRTRRGEFPSNNNHLATMETPDEDPPKRAKLSEPPKHGQRLFFSAMLY